MAFLTSCGSDNAPIVQNQEAITNAKSLRTLFDQSQGDYSKLSPSDQQAAQKAVNGGPGDVQKMFDFMKTSNKTGVPGNNPRPGGGQ